MCVQRDPRNLLLDGGGIKHGRSLKTRLETPFLFSFFLFSFFFRCGNSWLTSQIARTLSVCNPLFFFFFYTYGTWPSEVVSHPSTNQAQPCLASEIRRDLACSVWPGCRPLCSFFYPSLRSDRYMFLNMLFSYVSE